jgi:hypothetical protein
MIDGRVPALGEASPEMATLPLFVDQTGGISMPSSPPAPAAQASAGPS